MGLAQSSTKTTSTTSSSATLPSPSLIQNPVTTKSRLESTKSQRKHNQTSSNTVNRLSRLKRHSRITKESPMDVEMGDIDDAQRQQEEERLTTRPMPNSRRSSRRRTRSIALAHQDEHDDEDSESMTSRRIRRRMKGKSRQVDDNIEGVELQTSAGGKGKEKGKQTEGTEKELDAAGKSAVGREELPHHPLATPPGEENLPQRFPTLLDETVPAAVLSNARSLHASDASQPGHPHLPLPLPRRTTTNPNPFDISSEERGRARAQIAQALGMGAAAQLSGNVASPPDQARPSMLSALLTDILGIRGAQTASNGLGTGPRMPNTNGSNSDSAPAAGDNARSRSTNGGTSVIVQGALISRTLPSRQVGRSGNTAVAGSSESSEASHPTQRSQSQPPISTSNDSSTTLLPTEEPAQQPPAEGETQVATIEEQAAMLIRLLSIATAATAASLVSSPRAQQNQPQGMDRTEAGQQTSTDSAVIAQTPPQPDTTTSAVSSSLASSSSSSSSSWRHASQTYQSLRERFAALRSRFRGQRLGSRPTNDEQNSSQPLTPSVAMATPVRTATSEGARAGDLVGAEATEEVVEGPVQQNAAGSLNTLSSMLHDAIREGIQGTERGSRGSTENSNGGTAARPISSQLLNSRAQSVHATLDAVRGGQLSRGEEGSFDRFLFDLMSDLDVAVRGLPRENTTRNEAEVTTNADELTQSRRQRDLQDGQLSFFRLFTFPAASNPPTEPNPQTPALLPCVVVGVRSLDSTHALQSGLMGIPSNTDATAARSESNAEQQQQQQPSSSSPLEDADTIMHNVPTVSQADTNTTPTNAETQQPSSSPSSAEDGGENGQPMSRFLLFVSGGHYPPQHPLFHSSSDEASRDLMVLMEFLGVMASMHTKPNSTVTKDQIEKSKCSKVMGGLKEIKELVKEKKIMENTSERCLICLEDWKDESEDCRLLECSHLFHAPCIDQWLTASNNSCPLCRRQAVTVTTAPPMESS